MDGVAVCRDRGVANTAGLIRQIPRLDNRCRSALHRFIERMISVLHLRGDVSNSVSMLFDMLCCRMLR